MLFSVVASLPAPKVTPTHELASALVNSSHGSMLVATAEGSADSDGESLAAVSDGAGRDRRRCLGNRMSRSR